MCTWVCDLVAARLTLTDCLAGLSWGEDKGRFDTDHSTTCPGHWQYCSASANTTASSLKHSKLSITQGLLHLHCNTFLVVKVSRMTSHVAFFNIKMQI